MATLSMLAGSLGAEVWVRLAVYALVPITAWATFVARPLRSWSDAPNRWLRDSIVSFAFYALAYVGVSAGLPALSRLPGQ